MNYAPSRRRGRSPKHEIVHAILKMIPNYVTILESSAQ